MFNLTYLYNDQDFFKMLHDMKIDVLNYGFLGGQPLCLTNATPEQIAQIKRFFNV